MNLRDVPVAFHGRAGLDGAAADSHPSAADALCEQIAEVRSRIDLGGLPPVTRAVTERIICASGDLGYATDLSCAEQWLDTAASALAAGAPVIADAPMVAAGLAGCPLICKADQPLTIRLARTAGISRPAAAVRLAFGEAGPGAIWVVGCAPEAIGEILARGARPALVIGLPAGFGAATAAKQALRSSGAATAAKQALRSSGAATAARQALMSSAVPSLTNVSEKGGPHVAVAGCLALLDHARSQTVASRQVPP